MSDDIHPSEYRDIMLRAGYDAQKVRIDQLQSWVVEAISKPSMSRELREQGLELVEAQAPTVRQAVERICPSRTLGGGREMEIER